MPEAPSHLTIVPAGAGSGKTHYLQTELARRIQHEGLAPEKIVAVTFTEAAAAELRGRIRSELVKQKRLDDAFRLDQAYISTIHGFGLRLITEFAFDGGLAPSPRLLNDDEQAMLASKAMAHSAGAGMMMENLSRYGYSYDFNSNTSQEDAFRKGMLSFIATLRGIGKAGQADELIPAAEQKIRELYGEPRVAEHLRDALLSAITALLHSFPTDLSPAYSSVKSASDALRKDFNSMKRAVSSAVLDKDWKLWQSLRDLRLSNQRTKLPDGYDDLAEQVMSAASALPLHPGPLQDALNHASALLQAASECLGQYTDDKRQRGLVDFTDMLSEAHHLLCCNSEVLAAFKERIYCLVVDEFQDTNPLQFSLLWSLSRAGVPTIIVGDLKQAIMGFQGADARLMQELINQYPDSVKPQTFNYRSSKPLMNWINLVGEGLFGGGYTTLTTPKPGFESRLSPLEAIETRENLSDAAYASHVVGRLLDLLDDEASLVYDKQLNKHRRLRGGDIAIICPTHSRLQHYATALRSAGIRCRLSQDGWYDSRIVQLACYALQYLTDPSDRHAALYLAVTELGSHTLQSALDQLVAGNDLTDPILEKLAVAASELQDSYPEELLEKLIAALDLYGIIARWPDGVQARVNLLRLQTEAREFRTANREALASGGYYGTEVKTFLAWLKGRAERDNHQPEAAVIDEDAVQLATWHSSKGREWPVVAVCGTDYDVTPRLPSTRVSYSDFRNLADLLTSSKVEIFPDFTAPETADRFKEQLLAENRNSAARLLYVALTRSREKLILEWPGYLPGTKNPTGNTYWDILVKKACLELSGNTMLVAGTPVDCRITVVGKEAQELTPADESADLPPYGRIAIAPRNLPQGLTPEHCTPSSLHGLQETAVHCTTESYANPIELLKGMQAADRGTLLHRCFELLLARPELYARLPELLDDQISPEESALVADLVKSFNAYLARQLSPVALSSEEPFVSLNEAGTVVTGTIDLLVEAADGFWIVDHKSDQLELSGLQERAGHYYPQLAAYAAAVATLHLGKPVKGIMINWVSLGMVSVVSGDTHAL
jgi:ATP-dependent exoDNAse (exonuclease V) beta subunit